MNRLRENKEALLFATSTALILLGGVAWLLKAETPADVLWTLGTLLGLAFSAVTTTAAVIRRRPSVDIIAVLALAGADGPQHVCGRLSFRQPRNATQQDQRRRGREEQRLLARLSLIHI